MNIIAVTQKGPSKTENEDRIVVGKNIIANGILQTEISEGVIAIADGVGGNNAGAVASHFVAEKLTSLSSVSANDFSNINADLLSYSSSSEEYDKMATTLSGLAFHYEITQIFSVGNTRVYSLQGSKYLKQLTSDDTTLNYLLSTGQLSAEDAVSFDRKNEITACFGGGSSSLFKIKCNTVDQLASPFMMTSDGVHDYISVDQMEDIIAEHGMTISACEAMIALARNNGSMDDSSIVLGVI